MNGARLLRRSGSTRISAALPLACGHAEPLNCSALTTLPCTSASQGVHYRTGHLSTGSTSATALAIATNKVVLDPMTPGVTAPYRGGRARALPIIDRRRIPCRRITSQLFHKENIMKKFTFAFVFAALTALAVTAPARAETVNCTAITTLPYVITTQGVYCFTGNLSTAMTSGVAIDIQTNNVVLDLNGFKLGGLAAGLGTAAYGIYANNRQNITIKNGTVRGFQEGIFLEDSGAAQGHLVEDIRADQNTYIGIEVKGDGNIVRNNQVVATGGSTVFGANADAIGILVVGAGPRVLNNDVIDTVKRGSGIARGIDFFVTSGLAVNNRITTADRGIEFHGGSGKYRDNLTFGVTMPFVLGTDAGNNN